MPDVLEKPLIQCSYRNPAGQQCPLEAQQGSAFCKFHEPIR